MTSGLNITVKMDMSLQWTVCHRVELWTNVRVVPTPCLAFPSLRL